jgi:hypothetical protein
VDHPLYLDGYFVDVIMDKQYDRKKSSFSAFRYPIAFEFHVVVVVFLLTISNHSSGRYHSLVVFRFLNNLRFLEAYPIWKLLAFALFDLDNLRFLFEFMHLDL